MTKFPATTPAAERNRLHVPDQDAARCVRLRASQHLPSRRRAAADRLRAVNTESEGAVSATSGSSGGLCMGVLATGCSSINFGRAPWHIDGREAVAPDLSAAIRQRCTSGRGPERLKRMSGESADDVAYGSNCDVPIQMDHVRITSVSRRCQHGRLRPKSAHKPT